MHPILADKKKLFIYLSAWALVGVLLALLFLPALDWTTSLLISMPLAFIYAFMSLASWYTSRSLPLESTGFLRIAVVTVLSSVISSSLWLILARGLSFLLANILSLPEVVEQFKSNYPILFGAGVLLYLLTTAVHYLLIAFEASRNAERRTLELKVLAHEAELRALRAQIDPHFLFNSLNSISALTAQDPSAARTMCILLGEFLRKSLKLGAMERISLGEEIELIKNFLSVEQIRFGSRLKVDLSIVQGTENCSVPPLILQPLIENAIKHGISQLVDGGTIQLVTVRRGSHLSISVKNPVDEDQKKSPGNGIGLLNVKHRLSNLYGNDGRVDVAEKNGQFSVELELPAMEQRK